LKEREREIDKEKERERESGENRNSSSRDWNDALLNGTMRVPSDAVERKLLRL
jgi:hypothetical protein